MRIKDLYNYKEAYHIYKIIKDKSHPNLIVSHNYSKKTFITTILNEKFSITKNNIFDENIYYEYNDIYYYFDIKKVKLDIKDTFINTIKGITNTYNHYLDESNYIILDNYDNINPITESKLKVLIEKSQNTTKFILLTNNYDKIESAIKSRFIMIRIKPLSYYDKLHLFDEYKNVDNFEKILKDNDDIDLIKKLLNGFKNPYNIIIQKWLKISKSKFNLSSIKDLSYNFMCSSLDFPKLQKELIKYYINTELSCEKKSLIIKKNSDANYLMINCYKDIIYIEYYLIDLYNIIND